MPGFHTLLTRLADEPEDAAFELARLIAERPEPERPEPERQHLIEYVVGRIVNGRANAKFTVDAFLTALVVGAVIES